MNFGEKVITKYEWNEIRGHTYQYEGTDTPWFLTNERNLFFTTEVEAIADAMKYRPMLNS